MKVTLIFLLICKITYSMTFYYNHIKNNNILKINNIRKYPISRAYYEGYIKKLNNKNITEQNSEILNKNYYNEGSSNFFDRNEKNSSFIKKNPIIIINKKGINELFSKNYDYQSSINDNEENNDINDGDNYNPLTRSFGKKNKKTTSEHFEIISRSPYNFSDIGGYYNIKKELEQVIDIISNYTKYTAYNVRIPKGLIFEGPPGNGKTLFAKAVAGEANISFIAVSGSEFQEKYVGVGALKVRELFKLAKENLPCIIFIDEIDAIGRKRSGEGESSNTERDSTLNELLISLDGFVNTTGVFLIGATNRADLLDPALTRPGRIDKRIYIDNPDYITRKYILDIHMKGKPVHPSINKNDLVEITNGLSGAQIENLINESMLNALRNNRYEITNEDIDTVINKIMVGWQPNEHQFSNDIIDHIVIHELGHAVIGLLSKHHSKMTKVIINLHSPKTPGYTVFENNISNILTRESLFEHLMILLGGRIAEEIFYGKTYVSTGAINDFEEALKLTERMIRFYGMGKNLIYPSMSEKYKEIIDNEIYSLINDAYSYSEFIIKNSKDLILEAAEILKIEKILTVDKLKEIIDTKHSIILNLKYNIEK